METNIRYLYESTNYCSIKVINSKTEISYDLLKWKINDGSWLDLGEKITDLKPAYYSIHFKAPVELENPVSFEVRLLQGYLCEISCEIVLKRNYDISEIPPQTILPENALSFFVHSAQLGEEVILSVEITDGSALGEIYFDNANKLFTYMYDSRDKEPFTVTFCATLNGSEIFHDVIFSPVLQLIPEFEFLNIFPIHKLPNPESKEYISINTKYNPDNQELNFKNHEKGTRSITIIGKSIIFEDGHDNDLYNVFNDNDDIEEMRIIAETVKIKSHLKLPQSKVSIYSKIIAFIDDSSESCNAIIDVTPKKPLYSSETPVGCKGLDAKDIELNIETLNVKGDNRPRFILKGGMGQDSKIGSTGDNGDDLVHEVDYIYGREWPDFKPIHAGDIVLKNKPLAKKYNNIPVAPTYTSDLPDRRPPQNGNDANQPGRSGQGGHGGCLYSTIPISSDLFDVSGGDPGFQDQGEEGIGYRGGNPSQPNLVIWFGFKSGRYKYNKKLAVRGKHYNPYGDTELPIVEGGDIGPEGNFVLLDFFPLCWLHPLALKVIIKHAKDSFLKNHFEYSKEVLKEYLFLIDIVGSTYLSVNIEDDWFIDLNQFKNEILSILLKIENNLDFYGNPAGWVPMLSFEINKYLFDKEVYYSISTFYLAYLLKSAASSLDQKKMALEATRKKLRDEIIEITIEFNSILKELPEIVRDAKYISRKIDILLILLKDIETQILEEAENNIEEKYKVPFWKKTVRIAAIICKVIPAGQPLLTSVGQGLELISKVDSETHWSTISNLVDLSDEFAKSKIEESIQNIEKEFDKLKQINFENENLKNFLKTIFSLFGPISGQISSFNQILGKYQIPQNEIEAELKKLKASSPKFKNVSNDISELLEQKKKLQNKIVNLMQSLTDKTNTITQNVSSIDSFNFDLTNLSSIDDSRVKAFIDTIEVKATEKLQYYHYQMAKAYEYRLLKQYEWELDFKPLIVECERMLNEDPEIDLYQHSTFSSLKAIYEGVLTSMVEKVFLQYETEHEVTESIEFSLHDFLEYINNKDSVVIDLVDNFLFSHIIEEDSLRIRNINVIKFIPEQTVGHGEIDVYFDHLGDSILSKNGRLLKFRHSLSNDTNPLIWGARYHTYSGETKPIKPSPASKSLIRALLVLSGVDDNDENILFFSRPSAWTDLEIKKKTFSSSEIGIHELAVELKYDFYKRNKDLVCLEISVSADDKIMPYILIEKRDINLRGSGRGSFYRFYKKNVKNNVTLKAQGKYGSYKFMKWTDRYGNDLTDTVQDDEYVTLITDRNYSICANYSLEK